MNNHPPMLSDLETITPVETVLDPTTDNGDHDRFAHYARKSDITESAVTGKPVVALCGKMWIPNRNPDKYQVCPTCKEIYQRKKDAENAG